MATLQSLLRKTFSKRRYMNRIISDSYIKGTKQIWGNDPSDEFNRRILAVNNMYGWLYQQGILKKVAFKMKDYSDIAYFAFGVNDLLQYRRLMEKSGLPDAALAVHHIFDEEYRPCIYSGAIELGWTMRTYRDFDGTVGRSWECDLVRHLDSPSVLDIVQIQEQEGIRAAVHSVFELSEFEPSDLTKAGVVLSVRPLKEQDGSAAQKMDSQSGYNISPMLDGNEDYAWGVFKGEMLVGYCTIGYAEDTYEGVVLHPAYTNESLLLSDVYVSPEHREEGCASYLVSQAIKRRTENDKELVLLTVLDEKLASFYKRLGFVQLADGVMLRDERSIEDKKRDERFEKAFSYFSNIDLNMADKRNYLYDHADKLIYCYENGEHLDLIDVDCWSRFEVLLGTNLSHADYMVLNEFMDGCPNGIYDPHDIEEGDIETIAQLKALLDAPGALDDKLENAQQQNLGRSAESQQNKGVATEYGKW